MIAGLLGVGRYKDRLVPLKFIFSDSPLARDIAIIGP